MSNCVMCCKCQSECPLLAATGREEFSPRAKSDLLAVLEGDLMELDEEKVAMLLANCLGCGRCAGICPQGVDVPDMVARMRAEYPDFRARLWKLWLTRARELWPLADKASRLIPSALEPEKLAPYLKLLHGMKGANVESLVRIDSFPDTFRNERMMLFAGCTAEHVRADWKESAARLLDGLGVERVKANFRCCGKSMRQSGFFEEASEAERHNISVWRKAGKPKVVAFCSSCLRGLANYDAFDDDAERGEWADALTPLSSLLREAAFVLGDDSTTTTGWHRPCHAGESDPDEMLARTMLGDRMAEDASGMCCGFGGILQLANPALAGQVSDRNWEYMPDADMILTGCTACVAQLSATALENVTAAHWLDVIE